MQSDLLVDAPAFPDASEMAVLAARSILVDAAAQLQAAADQLRAKGGRDDARALIESAQRKATAAKELLP